MAGSTEGRAELIQDVLALLAAEDAERLVPRLLELAELVGGPWGGPEQAVLKALRIVEPPFRPALVHRLAQRYFEPAQGADGRRHIMHMMANLRDRTTDDDHPRDLRPALIAVLSEQEAHHDTTQLLRLTELERADGHELPGDFIALLRRTRLTTWHGKDRLGPLVATLTHPVVNPGEAWSDQALADLAERDESWARLVAHATTATAARPSAPWEKTGRALVEAVGAEPVRERLTDWLRLVGRPRTRPLLAPSYGTDPNVTFDPYNADALRGLTWLLSFLPPHPETARTLGALVETSLKKVSGLGPVNPKVANAGVTALARIDSEPALAELARLATRVTYKGTLKLLNTSLDARAEAMGLSREEIEELAVPAYGLTEVGGAEHHLGESTARIEVSGTKTTLSWRNATGKAVKSVPADVRRDHPDELKELKAAVKDIDKMLSAQSDRLDRQFVARRTWTYAAWRERYLDHPLVGTLARRLLWTIDGTTAGYADGALRTLTDTPVNGGTEVTLWHPVDHEPAEIVAWRDWLERHGITQPFKQAHREVYLLTDAERTTGTYSNRFAAHYLRQHQFHALAAVRGWRNKLRLSVDDEAPPATRELPAWGLRAEYWIQGDGGENHDDLTDSGSFLRLRTDQVRFYPIDAAENSAHCCGGEYRMRPQGGVALADPLPLTDIPPLVLSEVLRDVDLFVGVASVGNDPTWQDGGPGGRFQEYWTSYGFGELGASAETRRALLERLIPRLAIADRCTLDGRFLQVKGDRHTYKIHLGSGNILRTPNDQYLCIVPKSNPAAPQAGYLPYEGDRMLAVILSKAMMLAADTKITDRTILSQL
ncbi:DUF4132 domain-containing protein [Streptomyces justiciae]|uniref:DUF4132 domain-containing protein n=1 Tax=Streptomyces justiciae TaxID=2780140 RepID=UPI0018829F79|nr:DUF4132 domain-containing protein [Streptomyces justiciae]MBE8474306.1 DUF4132 domain-containing protein [Streptomyces justiciae]MCW8377866.1 DUF4132 domain-containing protein [Streptomyces justiciae]